MNNPQGPRPDPTQRFSNRVADYVLHRPAYPREVIECLSGEFGLQPQHVIADVGSGTGILTRMLLENGNRVFAVEPNGAMRRAAEEQLGRNPNFVSVAGSAETTGLADASVDWVTAAQAFHWFDVDRARIEAHRILRRGSEWLAKSPTPRREPQRAPTGRVAIIWNDRKIDTPFLQAYEDFLLEFGTDFKTIRHEDAQTDGRLERFFGNGHYAKRVFENEQILDEEGLRGRTLSASYMPGPDHPRHSEMLSALRRVFDEHQANGRIRLAYETKLYVGCLEELG